MYINFLLTYLSRIVS